jgi:hypothetical protein
MKEAGDEGNAAYLRHIQSMLSLRGTKHEFILEKN